MQSAEEDPKRPRPEKREGREISRLLVATDLSELSMVALETAGELARRLGASVTIFYVVEDHLPPILVGVTETDRKEVLEQHRRRAERVLETYVTEPLADHAVEVRAAIGHPAREIVRLAEEEGFDLIVMASHGYGPLSQILLGSTAERVLHHAPCPVLVVPSKRDRRGGTATG